MVSLVVPRHWSPPQALGLKCLRSKIKLAAASMISMLHPGKLTWLAGNSQFSIGNASSNGWLSSVMLIFGGGWTYPSEQYAHVKLDHLPRIGVKMEKKLQPPPSLVSEIEWPDTTRCARCKRRSKTVSSIMFWDTFTKFPGLPKTEQRDWRKDRLESTLVLERVA